MGFHLRTATAEDVGALKKLIGESVRSRCTAATITVAQLERYRFNEYSATPVS